MTVRLELDVAAVRKRLDGQRAAAQAALAAAVLRDCTPYVPMDTGELAASGVAVDGAVEWRAGHARAVYYGEGRAFRRDRHPLACARWFEAARAAQAGAWAEEARAAWAAAEGV